MMQFLFWSLSAVALVGALTVVLTRDVMRLALGLGALLLAVAGLFALFGYGFLALAELFVYVGGVLVIMLFALVLIQGRANLKPIVQTVHDPVAAVAAAGIGILSAVMLRPVVSASLPTFRPAGLELGDLLLGPMLAQFEMAGALLLVALVAVVLVMSGERR